MSKHDSNCHCEICVCSSDSYSPYSDESLAKLQAWYASERNCINAESRRLLANIHELKAELTRLKRGDWTPDEIHDICHNLHGKVGPQEFADGCAAEQHKLYGCAPDADSLVECRSLLVETQTHCEELMYKIAELNASRDRLVDPRNSDEPEET